MSDLFENQIQGINEPEFSVSEISNAIKRLIEEEFSYVRIRGEIGRVSLPRSGHVYLDLKDEKSEQTKVRNNALEYLAGSEQQKLLLQVRSVFNKILTEQQRAVYHSTWINNRFKCKCSTRTFHESKFFILHFV